MKAQRLWQKLLLVTILLMLTMTAYAAGQRITLDRNKPMETQIAAFKEWYAELKESDRKAWDAVFAELMTPLDLGTSDIHTFMETNEEMVWIPRSGKRYHSISTCSNMKDPTQVPLEEALDRGFTPCKRCVK